LDFKHLRSNIGTNFKRSGDREDLIMGDIKIFQVQKEDPFTLQYKTTYEESESYKMIAVCSSPQGTRNTVSLEQMLKHQPQTLVQAMASSTRKKEGRFAGLAQEEHPKQLCIVLQVFVRH
jgi:hypothetical protein